MKVLITEVQSATCVVDSLCVNVLPYVQILQLLLLVLVRHPIIEDLLIRSTKSLK